MGGEVPVDTACDMFLDQYEGSTRRAYGTALRQFRQWCAKRQVDPLYPSAADLRAFREDLESRLRPVSVRARQDAIVRFFAHLVERGVLERSPVPEGWRVKARYQRPDISALLSPGELARIASAADELGGEVACVVRLILEAGLRGGEIEQADVADLVESGGQAVLLVRPQRGGPPRRHHLAPRTAALLRGEVGGRTSGPLLRTPSGRRLSQRSLQRLLDPAVEAAGVTDRVTAGALRMAAMRRHLELGEPSRPVEEMLLDDPAASPVASTGGPATASAGPPAIGQESAGNSSRAGTPSMPAYPVPADHGGPALYRRSEHLVLELDGGSVYLRGIDGLHPLGRHGLAVIDAFVAPRTLGDVGNELGARATSVAEWTQATASMLRLIELGALEPAGGRAPSPMRERGTFADPSAHVAMLDDHRRTGSFLRALDEVVTEGATVCDIGTGTGVLAVAAAMRGAGHVFAIDALTGDWARRLARSNGVDGIVTVLDGWSTELELPQRADVLVTETISDDPPGERILETVIDARRRLLTSGATVVPAQLRIFAVPVQMPERVLRQQRFTVGNTSDWSAVHGQDFSPLVDAGQPPVGPKAVHPTRTAGWEALAVPTVLAEIDLGTVTSPLIEGRQRTRAVRAGRIDAVVVYFEAQLSVTVDLAVHWDERLAARTWSWSYAVWVLEAPIEVRSGDLLELGYGYRVPGRPAARRVTCSRVEE